MNNKVIAAIIVIGVVILGGSYFFNSKAPQAAGPIKIGFSMPLTGEAASYGESGMSGAKLAIKEINEAGGINGRMIEAVYEDDKCDPSGISAMQKLVNVDNVVAIVGPVCSAVAGGSVPVARAANIPTIMIGASAPGLAGGADSIFSGYASDNFQGKFVAEYIYNVMGKHTAAILYVKNDWGQGLDGVFAARFKELGGTIVVDEGAAQDSKDVKTVAAKVKTAKPDVVYMPTYPALAVVAIKQMKDIGVTAPIVGGDALEAAEFLNSGVAEGVTYFTGAVGDPDEFKAKIKALTGVDTNIVGPLAYDAVHILVKVIAEKGIKATDIIDGLNNITYTNGVSFKSISFDYNGDLEGATYVVKKIENGTVTEVK